ncbi:phosphoglycerate mutase family protein [Terfezia boudieri ATCC MYA-4762]|uniref:Phosphoglycerate mutase family protein n=1 Tax=Terfezia boudieri ATCC MYA-4762 TaxID=1051890 RepID=A0A3N4M1N5_9PEZI|nr:phosphoglycerate mutase family protein [Terfezia boudieri ATCC MYA-4762]
MIPSKWTSIKYSTVVGFFAQDLPETDDNSFDYISSNFGLLDNFQMRTQDLEIEGAGERDLYDSGSKKPKWIEFQEAINKLNTEAPGNVKYKVVFLARHGQGYHVQESSYGTSLWNCYWSLLDGDGKSRWDDAKLTESGVVEAQKANQAWKQQIKNGVPMPQSFYSSPLSRAAATLEITWKDITLNRKDYPKPIIKEKLRETLGIHVCDRRAPKCEIARAFPEFTFEKGFAEGLDPLWDPIHREPYDATSRRLKIALGEIFTSDDSTYLTISAHSGTIRSILEVIGHRKFSIQTGGMIPVVIKVEFSKEVEKPTTVSPSRVAPRCTVDPTPVAEL